MPNEKGRVKDMPGIYVAGWIKRGPTGVIGTNKPDAAETAEAMLADAAAGTLLSPGEPLTSVPGAVSFPDWQRLDRIETERGKALGRPRLKIPSVAEMLAALESPR